MTISRTKSWRSGIRSGDARALLAPFICVLLQGSRLNLSLSCEQLTASSGVLQNFIAVDQAVLYELILAANYLNIK